MNKNGAIIKRVNLMLVTPHRLSDPQDQKLMESLITPDNQGPWAVRYLWIQHVEDNDTFYSNYFDPNLSQAGMNVRKTTADLTDEWRAHNQIFYDSAENGDLVWRVKVGNPKTQSIDYIEVWRNLDILNRHFGENISWGNVNISEFNNKLLESGFDIRTWYPFNTISKIQAMSYYKMFVEQWRQQKHCIINTPWKKDINPL